MSRKGNFFKSLSLACLGAATAIAVGGPAQAGERAIYTPSTPVEGTQRVYMFSGIDVSKDAHYYYSGSLIALNGDFGRDGFVFRTLGVIGDFEYDTAGVEIDGDDRSIDVMLGYQFTRGVITSTIYAGVEYRDIDLSPNDTDNDVQGDEVGFKVALDAQTSEEIPFFASFSGAYSTAFDTFYALGRTGYNAKRFVIGPEGLIGGEEGDNIYRVGGFYTHRFNLTPYMPAEVTLNGGYQFVEDDGGGNFSSGGEGGYGGVSFSFGF